MSILRLNGLAAAALLLVSTVSAADRLTLTEVWQAALVHDPVMAAAQAQRDAGRARRSEARALWLPTLAATGSAGRGDMESRTQGAAFSAPTFGSTNGVDFRTSVNGGTATRWSLVAEQPLFDAARLADFAAQRNSAFIAEARYRAAEQELMVRSTRAYFEVLNARAQLVTLQQLHASAEKSRSESQARYQAGDIPATDTREAQARADAISVQELDARAAVTLNEAAFADLTGLDASALGGVPATATDGMPHPETLEYWLQRAASGSSQLAIQRLLANTAAAQVNRYGALSGARVSLVAQVGRDALHGSGDFGGADITNRQSGVGIQASLPLFTGGMRSAQRHEAQALQKQSEAELNGAEQQVRQQARAAWLNLTTAMARVQALQRLRESAAGRMEATRLGAETGGRTTLELLNAEADYLQAGADYQRAQSNWMLAALQLRAVAGELAAADIEQLDQRLAGRPPAK